MDEEDELLQLHVSHVRDLGAALLRLVQEGVCDEAWAVCGHVFNYGA